MALSDAELQILIKFINDNQGAVDAQKGLQGVTEKTGEAEKAGGKFELTERSIHQLLHLVGRESGPQAEAALAGVAAVGTGELILVVVALKAIVESLNHMFEAQEKLDRQVASVWIATRDAMRDAREQLRDFNRDLEQVQTISDKIKESFDVRKAQLDAVLEGHKKILEALEKEQLAEAAGDKAREEAVKQRFDDLKRQNDIAGERQKLEQQTAEVQALQGAAPGLAGAARTAEARVQEAMTDRGFIAAQNRVKAGNEADLAEQVTQAQRMLHGLQAAGIQDRSAEENVRVAQLRLEAFRADQKTVEEHEAKLKDLNKALDDAKKAYKDNEAAIKEQSNKLMSSAVEFESHVQTAATEGRLASLTKFVQGNETGTTAMQDLLAAVGFTTEAQKAVLAEIKAHHETQKEVLNQIVAELRRMGVYNKDIENRINSAVQ